MADAPNSALRDRLAEGPLLCAEGYLFELERRGYLQAGAFVPEVVLEHPEAVTALHREFVAAGSDVVEAFTYYAHREKLRIIGREDDLERMNRRALEIAAGVARETGALLAGDLCNTNVYDGRRATPAPVRAMFEEQVGWAAEAGVDFVIGETFQCADEALLAARGDPRRGPARSDHAGRRTTTGSTREGWTPADACRRLADAGADVVGLNCIRGPETMLPLLEGDRATRWTCPSPRCPSRTARTSASRPSSRSPTPTPRAAPDGRPFPVALDARTCTPVRGRRLRPRRRSTRASATSACAAAPAPHHVRAMAEAMGRRPAASRYSADMSKHAYLGTDASLRHSEHRVRRRCDLRTNTRSSVRAASAARPRTGSAAGAGADVVCLEQFEPAPRPRRVRGPFAHHPARLPRRALHGADPRRPTRRGRVVEERVGAKLVHRTGMVNIAGGQRGRRHPRRLRRMRWPRTTSRFERFDGAEVMRRWPQFRIDPTLPARVPGRRRHPRHPQGCRGEPRARSRATARPSSRTPRCSAIEPASRTACG